MGTTREEYGAPGLGCEETKSASTHTQIKAKMMNARTFLALLLVAVCASVASAAAGTRNLQQSVYIPGTGTTVSIANVIPFYTEGILTEGLLSNWDFLESYLDYGLEGIISDTTSNLGNIAINAASGGQDYLTVG